VRRRQSSKVKPAWGRCLGAARPRRHCAPDRHRPLADGGYNRVPAILACFPPGLASLIVGRSRGAKGFVPLPRRCVAKRTPGWLGRWHRSARDYEYLPEVSETMVMLAMIRLMLHRAVHPTAADQDVTAQD